MSSMSGGLGMRGPAGNASGQTMAGAGMLSNKIPRGYKEGRIAQYQPEQMDLFRQLFGHVGPNSYLSRLAGGDESMFEEMEAPAMRQFGALQGQLASRFSGMGMGGRGSGFKNTMNQATSDFAQDLQSRRQGLQRQAIMDLMGLSQNLLQERPYETNLIQKAPRQRSNWGGAIGAGLGAIGGALGGPFGAVQGANFGSQIGSAFG